MESVRELAGEAADARRSAAEATDHGAPGRIGEGDEHAVELR
jgi:hypothetical protein